MNRTTHAYVVPTTAALLALVSGLLAGPVAAQTPTSGAGEPAKILSLDSRVAGRMVWSQDGKLLAVPVKAFRDAAGKEIEATPANNNKGHWSAAIQLWDLGTGKLRKALPIDNADRLYTVAALTFSPDASILAVEPEYTPVGQAPRAVQFWDVAAGKVRNTWTVERTYAKHAVSPDGETLAVWQAVYQKGFGPVRNGVRLLDAHTGKVKKTLPHQYLQAFGEEGIPLALGFSPSGKTLVTAARDAAFVWSIPAGKKIRAVPSWRFNGPFAGLALTISADGHTLYRTVTGAGVQRIMASGPRGGGVIYVGLEALPGITAWDLRTGKTELRWKDFKTYARPDKGFASFFELSWRPNYPVVAAADRGEVKLWNATTHKLLRTWTPAKKMTLTVPAAFAPDGRRVAIADDQTVKIWALEDMASRSR